LKYRHGALAVWQQETGFRFHVLKGSKEPINSLMNNNIKLFGSILTDKNCIKHHTDIDTIKDVVLLLERKVVIVLFKSGEFDHYEEIPKLTEDKVLLSKMKDMLNGVLKI